MVNEGQRTIELVGAQLEGEPLAVLGRVKGNSFPCAESSGPSYQGAGGAVTKKMLSSSCCNFVSQNVIEL